jgi:hypothetical protein
MRWAIVDAQGVVENIIDASEEFTCGENIRAIRADSNVGPGWSWDGEKFSAPAIAAVVPQSVGDLQFRLALNVLGLRAAAESVIANGSQGLRDYWDRSLQIHRDHPFIAEAAKALGKSSQEIDDLFILAADL